jgi:lysophospholipase L1-like esterase
VIKRISTKSIPSRRFALAAGTVLLGGLALGLGGNRPVIADSDPPAPVVSEFTPIPAKSPGASEINEFLKSDQKQMPPTGAVLFMGSSTIKIWDTMARDFSEIPVINRGFGGSLIQESTLYVDRIAVPYKPKIIVLCAGANDLAYGNKSAQQVFQDYKDFVAKVHAALPDTRIVYLSINPTVARWKLEPQILEANHLIEEFAIENNSKDEKLNFINAHPQLLTPDGKPQPSLLRSDGLHFNAAGYKVWTAMIKPRIMALAEMDGVQHLRTANAK